MHSEIELTREVEAIQIPSGDKVLLPAGIKVIITQSLGGSYTVATEQGKGLDYALTPAILLLAFYNKFSYLPIKINLFFIDSLQSTIL